MKSILTILISFFCLSALSAQTIQIGPKAGLNIANWTTNFDNTSSRLAYHLGGFGKYQIDDQFSAGAELLFSNIGVRINKGDFNEGRVVLQTLSIPLLAHYQITEDVSAHAGLQPSLIMNAKTVITGGENNRTTDNNDVFNGMDFAFVLGGEYVIQEKVHAGLRIQLGLNNVFNDDPDDEIKNTVFQLYASFPLVTIEQ